MKLQDIVKDAENIYLSGEDVLELTDHRCRIMKYQDLMFVNSIDEILDVDGSVIILYQKTSNSGHFCLLTKKYKENSLYFFDPYGYDLDEEVKLADFQVRNMNGVVPHLTHLIENSNYDLIVNKIQYQEFEDLVNTCGRHCVTRLNYIHLSDEEYNTFINKNSHYDADFWVSVMTIDFHNYI